MSTFLADKNVIFGGGANGNVVIQFDTEHVKEVQCTLVQPTWLHRGDVIWFIDEPRRYLRVDEIKDVVEPREGCPGRVIHRVVVRDALTNVAAEFVVGELVLVELPRREAF